MGNLPKSHSLCPKVKLQVPPLRCAPVGMTKSRVVADLGSDREGWTGSTNDGPNTNPVPPIHLVTWFISR